VYYVYLIKCIDKHGKISYYCGYTNDPVRRYKEHMTGRGARYTRSRKLEPMRVIYHVAGQPRDAMKLEKKVKKMKPVEKKYLYDESTQEITWDGNGTKK